MLDEFAGLRQARCFLTSIRADLSDNAYQLVSFIPPLWLTHPDFLSREESTVAQSFRQAFPSIARLRGLLADSQAQQPREREAFSI
jgi:hypothetical protein